MRALTVNKPDRTAKIVQLYRGHNDVVNDLVVTFHVLLSASDEVICHNLGTGREKWRLLKFCNKRVMALSVLGDTLVCCMEDCSVAMINIRRGSLLYFVELKGERAGGVPFIGVDAFNRLAYVQGNRSVNGWSMVIGRRVFNTDLVLGQVRQGVGGGGVPQPRLLFAFTDLKHACLLCLFPLDRSTPAPTPRCTRSCLAARRTARCARTRFPPARRCGRHWGTRRM